MPETLFDYSSAFKYTKVSQEELILCGRVEDVDEEPKSENYPIINQLVHKIIVAVFYTAFVVTFPISAFFCLQRIHSLQRCLIYRLGIRLPLKGPGLIIRFPLIDCIEIIDLSDYEFVLVDKSQQLMTSDGSIIEFQSFNCCLNVMNAIRSSTKLKDAKFNVQQFCKLSFINMIGSTHLEDFENKTDTLLKEFEQNCNLYLDNWGYNCKFNQLPKFVVINRADPTNPIVYKLKSMFNGDAEEGTAMMAELFKFRGNSGLNPGFWSDSGPTSGPINGPVNGLTDSTELSEEKILESLQTMAEKYGNYVFHDIYISIQVMDSRDYFTFSHSTGKVSKLSEKPNNIHINISADTTEELRRFCCNQDMKSVRITTNLI